MVNPLPFDWTIPCAPGSIVQHSFPYLDSCFETVPFVSGAIITWTPRMSTFNFEWKLKVSY